ncbi:MAG: outer membrane lipoprotein-sorting protein [Candidatus Binatia bacterium]
MLPFAHRGVFGSLLVALLLPNGAAGETAREILDQVVAVSRSREPKDLTQTLRMTNFVRDERIFARELETSTKFYPDDASKVVTYFLAPADIKGVAFLAWQEPGREDVQWLYLPKTHRVRQIGAPQRRESFQDSVFTYEDLELFAEMIDWTEKDAKSRIAREREILDGAACVVIELEPLRDDVSYGRFLLWIHRPDSTLRRAELYDRTDGELMKKSTFSKFRAVGRLPVAHEIQAENVRTGLRTVLEISETRIDEGIDEEVFTPWHLERASR